MADILHIPKGSLLYRGKILAAEVSESLRKPSVTPCADILHINYYVHGPKEPVREIIMKWLKKEARHILYERTAYFASLKGLKYGRIAIKDQSSRWGSCSSLSNINYNWRIIMAPDTVLDYLVIHELTHLIHMNHSADFWHEVESMDPCYIQHRQWLRDKGKLLFHLFPKAR